MTPTSLTGSNITVALEGNTWTQLGSDIDGEGGGDESGFSVSLSSDGSILAIGADLNDGNGNAGTDYRSRKSV